MVYFLFAFQFFESFSFDAKGQKFFYKKKSWEYVLQLYEFSRWAITKKPTDIVKLNKIMNIGYTVEHIYYCLPSKVKPWKPFQRLEELCTCVKTNYDFVLGKFWVCILQILCVKACCSSQWSQWESSFTVNNLSSRSQERKEGWPCGWSLILRIKQMWGIALFLLHTSPCWWHVEGPKPLPASGDNASYRGIMKLNERFFNVLWKYLLGMLKECEEIWL